MDWFKGKSYPEIIVFTPGFNSKFSSHRILGVKPAYTNKLYVCMYVCVYVCMCLYPLVNLQNTMEHHHFSWANLLFQWPCSIANC